MSRPETQLREYFDAGVERISAEDVIARARVSEAGLRPLRAKRNLKPAWAAVGAFAATLVGLGGLASVLKLAPRIAVDAGAVEILESDGGTVGVWLVAAAVAAVAAGLTVWLVYRPARRIENEEEIESEQGKVTVMETIERTDTDNLASQRTDQWNRWPIVVIVVMAIALVGLIAWMTLAMRPNSPTAAPPEVQQLMEDYVAAFNSYDADALESLVTGDYEIQMNLADGSMSSSMGMDAVRSNFLPMLEGMDWSISYDRPYYAVGSDFSMFVSSEGARMTATAAAYPDGDKDSVDLFRIVKVGDEWKVSDHFSAFQN